MSNLEAIERWARERLEAKNTARERALARSRELIRTCARTIRAVHRLEFEPAGALLAQADEIASQMLADLEPHPDLTYTGYVQDAMKELVEAHVTLRLVRGESLPDPVELGAETPAFLNGLSEAIGELRRHVLDRLRAGETERCEPLLRTMDDIYSLLITLDYPDALTGGLRRATDIARGIVEKTRGDLTFALRQDGLERKLARLERGIETSHRPTG